MKARFLPTLLVLTSLAFAATGEHPVDGVLTIEGLWSLDQDAFQKATPKIPFEWTSAARDSARAGGIEGMTLFGLPVYELVVRFDQNKVGVVTAVFYARGDAGEVSEGKFEAMRQGTIDTLT